MTPAYRALLALGALLCFLGATPPTPPEIALSGKGECRFSLSSEEAPSNETGLSSFECKGDYRVVTEGNELSAPSLAYDGTRLRASGGITWKDERNQRTVTGEKMEYDFEERVVQVTGSIHALAREFSAESDDLRYQLDSGTLKLTGAVHIAREGETLDAQSVGISADGAWVAETGVLLKREEWVLRCNRIEQSAGALTIVGDVFLRAQVAGSEVALTASKGDYSMESGVFRFSQVTVSYPGGDLRADQMEMEMKTQTLVARGNVVGTIHERQFSSETANIRLDDLRIVLSGRVKVWIPREEFRRGPS